MKYVCYHQWNELPDNASSLCTINERDSIFLSEMWFKNIIDYGLPEDHTVCLACVVENESLLALLPMMKKPDGSLSSLSSNFTSLFSLLLHKQHKQQAIMACLAKGLSEMPTKPIQLEPIDAHDKAINQLIQAMQTLGMHSYPYFSFHNWSHQLNGQTYQQYLSTRPSQLRNTIMRKQRKLQRQHNYEFRLYIDNNIESALSDYQLVYAASWKANEFHQQFTPNLVKKAAQLNWLRLGVLYVKQQPIAAQIWLTVHHTANIYRLVYDETWKHYSPGSILTQHLMQYAIDRDHVTEIDFLTGNENYKQDWMTNHKERIGVRLIYKTKTTSWLERKFNSIKNKIPSLDL